MAYLPVQYILLYAGAWALIFALLISRERLGWLGDILRNAGLRWGGLPRILRFSIVGLGAVAIFYIFSDSTYLLGDGILRIGEIDSNGLRNLFSASSAEPLDLIIHYAFLKLICKPLRLDPLYCYTLLSFLAGLIYLWAARSIALQLKNEKVSFWLPFLYLLGWGGLFVFFGYAEAYGLAASVMLLFISYVIKYFNKGHGLVQIVTTFLIGFFLHNLLLVLLPAVLYLLFIEYKSNKRWAILAAITAVIPVAIWLVISYPHKESGAFLLPSSGTEPGYLLWSIAHLIDIVNELFLVSPAILIMLSLPKISGIFAGKNDRLRIAVWLIALSGLAVLIFVDPQLGMARDWDLFALPLLAFHFALFISINWSSVSTYIKCTVIIILMTSTFIWIQINSHVNLALARYENLMPLDHERGRYGYDRLGVYYLAHAHLPEAETAYENSIKIRPHARSYLSLAEVEYGLGKKDRAIIYLNNSLAMAPYQPNAIYNLGKLYYEVGQSQNALDTFKRLQMTPGSEADSNIVKIIARLELLTANTQTHSRQ